MATTLCYFVTDLHGKLGRYEKLWNILRAEPPQILFIGGDFLPSHVGYKGGMPGFIKEYLHKNLSRLKSDMGKKYPLVFLVFGNDDPRIYEKDIEQLEKEGLLIYLHKKVYNYHKYQILGYSYVPPTPFQLKDWERYDVSRYTDPGCIPPEEGRFTVLPPEDIQFYTIENDLEVLARDMNLEKTIVLFHTPPYKTALDRAALDGIKIDHVPLDVHVGSIAVTRFVEKYQPAVTLHGHIHESSRLTGDWKERIGNTWCLSAATEGDYLAVVKFEFKKLSNATRILV